MYNLNKLLSKFTLLLLATLGLAACATNPSSRPNNSSPRAVPTSACVSNPYLQKYGCSVRRIDQAAQSGDPDAQYALGYMYYYGIGTVRDKETAQLWIDRAAKQGQPLARKAQDLITSGRDFHHLHRQKAGSGFNAKSDAARKPVSSQFSDTEDAARSAHRDAGYAPTPDVKVLNSTTPDKPLREVLPNYGNKPASEAHSKEVIKSLQKPSNDDASSNPHSGKVEPITQRDVMTPMEKQILAMPKANFTLQLMGGRNLEGIKEFAKQHNIQGEVRYYLTQLNHEKWYILLYGNYSSATRAQAAEQKLPLALRELHPWVKSYRLVQDEIRSNRVTS